MRGRSFYSLVLSGAAAVWNAVAEQRFPPPEFESGHQLPVTTVPPPKALWQEYADVAVLLVCLGLACYLVYRRRSRRGVWWLSIFSLIYFGFYRKGCICPIGAPQNVALGFFEPAYAVPVVVAVFFIAPLLVALFAGRTFCAAVCPHGALQDLLLIKPVKVPTWLETGLSVIPYIYLGTGVFFAAAGSAFVICRYDPFVPFFRLSGGLTILAVGGGFIFVSMFVGRPYCRFLCPYGALLRLTSLVSKWRVRITPDFCTKCRLCEESCPFGAIRAPVPPPANPMELSPDRRRLGLFLVALPALIAVFALIGNRVAAPAALVHPTVALAERYLDPAKPPPPKVPTPDSLALERADHDPASVLSEAVRIKRRFSRAGWWFGGWVGLVIGVRLISLTARPVRADYEPDRGSCFACGRCFMFCPNERLRLGLISPSELPGAEPSRTDTPLVASVDTGKPKIAL